MFDSRTLDDLAARLGKAFEASPAKDLEKNVKAVLQGAFTRLDLVTRADFDTQREVLARTRAMVEALEARVAAMEAARGAPAPASPDGPPDDGPSAASTGARRNA